MNTKTYTVISTCGDPHICSTLEDAITKRDAMMRGDLEAWKYFNPGEKMSASYHIVDQDGNDAVAPEHVTWKPDRRQKDRRVKYIGVTFCESETDYMRSRRI